MVNFLRQQTAWEQVVRESGGNPELTRSGEKDRRGDTPLSTNAREGASLG